MELTKPTKVILGLATVINILSPLLGILAWIIAVFTAAISSDRTGAQPTWLFFIFFFLFLPLILLAGLSALVVKPVYLIHIIKNNRGNDLYRILSAIGILYLPWLAMPFYFLVYIWPDQPPAWALEGTVSKAPPGAVKAQPEAETKETAEAILAGSETLPVEDESAGESATEVEEWMTETLAAEEISEEADKTALHTGDLPAHPDLAAVPGPEAAEAEAVPPDEAEALPAADEPSAADEWASDQTEAEEAEELETPSEAEPPGEEIPGGSDATIISPSLEEDEEERDEG